MTLAIDITSWICILAGSFFALVGGIGIVRLPDFYTRMHAAGLTDTMGAILIVVGLVVQAGVSMVSFKLIMILFFLLITSPTSAHALASSALAAGVHPLLGKQDRPGEPEEDSSSNR